MTHIDIAAAASPQGLNRPPVSAPAGVRADTSDGSSARRRGFRWWAPLHSFRLQMAIAFGGLTIIFCGAIALSLGSMLTHQIQSETARSLKVVSETAARTLANGMSERLVEVQVLANSADLWVDGLNSDAVERALARSQAAHPNSAWIGVADTNGLVKSATAGILVGQSVAKRPWFNRGLRESHVGDVHRAELLEKLLPRQANGEPIRFVDFSAPIEVKGKVLGVIGVHGTWAWAREVITSLTPTDARERGLGVYIFDRAGKVLYAPDGDAAGKPELMLEQLQPSPSVVTRAAGAGADVVTWPDGNAYLTAIVSMPTYSAVTDLGWQVVSREPVSIAFARAHAASNQALGIGVLVALLASVLAWWLSGWLSRPMTAIARSARDVQNRVPGARLVIRRDNHEVQHLSTALVAMADRLNATVATAPVGICQLDANGRILSANDSFCRLLDVGGGAGGRVGGTVGGDGDAEHLFQRPLAALISVADRQAFSDDLLRLRQGHIDRISREMTFNLEPGRRLDAALSASMVPSTDSQDAYFVVVLEDISQRKVAENARRANAAKSAFLSQVSHELRTPLNAIIGFSQLMQLDAPEELSEKQSIRVDAIAGAGTHLLAMINDLLDLTQIESDRLSMSLGPVSLSVALHESLALVQDAAAATGVTVDIHRPTSETHNCIEADPLRLRQVLVNLLSNAVKYNRPGGTITIRWQATRDRRFIELTVADTGTGIRADKLDQLFQPFNRLGAESSTIQGTGIGLVITRKLVEMMHGQIKVSSTQGVGTCMTIVFPRADIPTPTTTVAARVHEPAAADRRLSP